MIAAFLSAEDKRFYEHGGLDFAGIGRAVYRFVETKAKGSNRRAEGASTITQQVAKNFLLSSDRTLERKIKEAILSIRIERAYSKDKILELYLNEIYLGLNSYGVAAAALNYFNKELSELSVEEAAYLAALPKAPNNYHPFRKPKEATIRRDWIIDQMADVGYITAEQAKTAKAKRLAVNVRNLGTQISAADYFAEDVRRTLSAHFGEDGLYGRAERTSIGDDRVNGGLSVRTTLDPNLQRMARKALIDGLVTFDREKGWRGPVQKIEIGGDWGVVLGGIEIPNDLAPWRLGVVLEAQKAKAVVGLRPGRQTDGTFIKEREAVEISFEEVKWAKSNRATPKAVTDVLNPGDVIWVAPKNADQPTGAWSLMQVPEVGAASSPWTRTPGACMPWPADFHSRAASSIGPCRPSASRAPRSSRWSTRQPSTTATSRPASCSTRRSRSTRGPARRCGNPRTTMARPPSAPPRCVSASKSHATR